MKLQQSMQNVLNVILVVDLEGLALLTLELHHHGMKPATDDAND